MISKLKKDKVFYISSISLICILIYAFFNIKVFERVSNNALEFLLNKFYWFYSGAMLSFFIFCVYLIFSKYGNIKLGKDDEKAEYGFVSWLAMLFCAGMGMGLVFWAVAEPLIHYTHPLNMEPFTEEAKMFALGKSFLHWGTSAWACYAILALILAYMQFRKGKPALMSSALIPIIGEKRAKGWIGNVIDIFTIFATVAGVITSLGLGTLQINAGLNFLFGVPENIKIKLVIIGIVTVCYMTSAVVGINKGIKILSDINLFIAALMITLVVIVGPTSSIFKNLFSGLAIYGKELVTTNNNIFLHGDWYKDWTLFYWGWWIAWAPPVGIFIARISRGRTIKEFLTGVLIIPSLLCLVWFSVFGTMGFNVGHSIALEAAEKTQTAFFIVLNKYPLGFFICNLVMILSMIFFITSADSSTFVLAMLSSNGKLNPDNSKKIVWGILQGALTVVFLLAGGLKMIQTASVLAAFPFAFIMIFSMVSFKKCLKEEKQVLLSENEDQNEFRGRIKENITSLETKCKVKQEF
ncbi:BCCT family transporter [Clostridium sp. ZS2-4]|uniref:BCCT family transporter n=1 Tax=Clostridium sp. ZS2-4 TaxID=2987703 RepID=UPI00227B61C1|nr:BCCT family transporter [Clostridium sp. ZS2-4]MCY6353830.1 BCCT family transporter [Clostridium sp. ZS2-4]